MHKRSLLVAVGGTKIRRHDGTTAQPTAQPRAISSSSKYRRLEFEVVITDR